MAHLAITGGKPLRQTPFPYWPRWDASETAALQRVLQSGRWGAREGGEVQHFEEEFAAYQGASQAIAVTNGSSALKLALTAAGVGVGDEVIMPGYTFVATATAALEIGAVPVFADIDPHTYSLDRVSVEACITLRTRALVPVHLGGRSADMEAIPLPMYRQPVMLAKNFALHTLRLFYGVYPQTPDYHKTTCPVTDYVCDEEAVWIRQNMLLGERHDMDDIVAAIRKIRQYYHELLS